jgi:hypothetical protein
MIGVRLFLRKSRGFGRFSLEKTQISGMVCRFFSPCVPGLIHQLHRGHPKVPDCIAMQPGCYILQEPALMLFALTFGPL